MSPAQTGVSFPPTICGSSTPWATFLVSLSSGAWLFEHSADLALEERNWLARAAVDTLAFNPTLKLLFCKSESADALLEAGAGRQNQRSRPASHGVDARQPEEACCSVLICAAPLEGRSCLRRWRVSVEATDGRGGLRASLNLSELRAPCRCGWRLVCLHCL